MRPITTYLALHNVLDTQAYIMLVKPIFSPPLKDGIPFNFKRVKLTQRKDGVSQKLADIPVRTLEAVFNSKDDDDGLVVERPAGTPEFVSDVSNIKDRQYIENDYFIVVKWIKWDFLSRVSSDYTYFILLKDHSPATSQLYRIVAQAVSRYELVQDWNYLMRRVMPILEGKPTASVDVHECEALLEAARMERVVDVFAGGTVTSIHDLDQLKRIRRVKHYVTEKVLASGAYGLVQQGQNEITQEKVAIKMIIKSEKDVNAELEEFRLLQRITHPYIISAIDVVERERYMFIILGLATGGTLTSLLSSKPDCKMAPTEAKHLFYQMLHGVSYLHDKLIAHRDIKPDNILLDNRGNVKITDFGAAVWLTSEAEMRSEVCGTIYYVAPELVPGPYLPRPLDVWALGVVLFNMTTGMFPFIPNTNDVASFLAAVAQQKLKFPDGLDEDAKIVITCMMTLDPVRRVALKTVLKYVWFKDNEIAFQSCVKENSTSTPSKRVEYREQSETLIENMVKAVDNCAETWGESDLFTSKNFAIFTKKRRYTTRPQSNAPANECSPTRLKESTHPPHSRSPSPCKPTNQLGIASDSDQIDICPAGGPGSNDSTIQILVKGTMSYPADELMSFRAHIYTSQMAQEAPLTIEKINENTEIVYIKMYGSIEGRERDFCLLQTSSRLTDGRFVFACRSVTHDGCPIIPGVNRGTAMLVGWVLSELAPSRTAITALYDLDVTDLNGVSFMTHTSENVIASFDLLKLMLDRRQHSTEKNLGTLQVESAIKAGLRESKVKIGETYMKLLDMGRSFEMTMSKLHLKHTLAKKESSSSVTGSEERPRKNTLDCKRT
eukprot:CFRG6357T1